MNKRGFLPLIPLSVGALIVIGIVLLIAFGGSLWFISANKWLLMGGAVIVLTFIYAVPALISGKASKAKITFVLALFAIGLLIMILPRTGLVQETSLGGYTSLAISNVEVVDSGQRIRIFGTATGSESVDIYFTPDQITSYIKDDDYKATIPLRGTVSLSSQTKEFQLRKNTEQSFSSFSTIDIGRLTSCSKSACSSNTPSGYASTGTSFRSPTMICQCLYQKSLGVDASFTGQIIDDTTVSFTIGGSTGSLRPSQGQNTLILNDGKTKIEWIGNLNNYLSITPPNYDALFTASKFDRLISQNAYALYKDAVNQFGTCIGSGSNFFSSYLSYGLLNLPSLDKVATCKNTFNNQVNTILASKTSSYQSSIGQSVTFDEDSMNVDLKTATTFPTFIITVDASKVGVVELKGTPEILSCVTSKTINSGDTYSAGIKVKNIGESSGSFYGQVICDSSKVSGNIFETVVSQGSTSTLQVQISGQNTQSGTSESLCTFKIIDRKSSASDSCSTTIGVKYQSGIVCEPGVSVCLTDKILRICSSDGTSFTDSVCQYDCFVDSKGLGLCRGKDEIPECLWYQEVYSKEDCGLWCKMGISKPTVTSGCRTSVLVYVVSALIFAVLVVIGLMVSAPKRRKR